MMFARAGSTRSGLEEEELFLKKIWAWHTQGPKPLPKSIFYIHTRLHSQPLDRIHLIIQWSLLHRSSKSEVPAKHHST